MAPNMVSGLSQGSIAALVDTNGDSYTDSVVFSFGDIINYPDGISQGVNDTIIIEVVAVVINTTTNVGGLLLTSTATFAYKGTNAVNITSPGVTVKVVEPLLNISKVATPTTNLQADDVVNYTVTIMHTALSTSTAFGLSITDNLFPGLLLVTGSVNVSAGAAQVVIGQSSTDKTVLVTLIELLPTDAPIVITYSAKIGVVAYSGDTIVNRASLLYSSSPLGPYNGNNVRNRTTTATSAVTILAPTITATMNTSSPEIIGRNVSVGELITFTLNITLPQATTHTATYVLHLPSTSAGKIAPLIGTVRSMPTTAHAVLLSQGSTLLGTDASGDGILDTITFAFGDIVNNPHPLNNPPDLLILDVLAVVVNDPSNVNGKVPITSFEFDYVTTGQSWTLTQAIQVTVVEPALVIMQTVTPTAGLQASNTVVYSVNITHLGSSTSPAFLPVVTAALSDKLTLNTDSVTVSAGAHITSTSNNTLVIQLDEYLLGASPIIFSYSANVTTKAVLNSYVPNAVNVTYYSNTFNPQNSLQVRTYSNVASSQFLMQKPTIAYALNSTSIAETTSANVAVGETISLLATITIPAGTLADATLTIALPTTPGQIAVVPNGGTVVFMPNNIVGQLSAGSVVDGVDTNGDGIRDSIVFDFGSAVDTPPFVNNTVVVEVIALVVNTPSNVPTTTLPTTCTLRYSNGVTPYSTSSPSIIFTVVGPKLLAQTTATPSTGVQAGDIISYTLTIWHDTPTSTSAAFNIDVIDLMSRQVSLVPGSVTTSTGYVGLGNGSSDTTISVFPATFNIGDVLTVTYQGVLTSSVPTHGYVSDTASVVYYTSPNNAYNPGNILQSTTTSTVQVRLITKNLPPIIYSCY